VAIRETRPQDEPVRRKSGTRAAATRVGQNLRPLFWHRRGQMRGVRRHAQPEVQHLRGRRTPRIRCQGDELQLLFRQRSGVLL
jgi:hypothetical protein